jgi:Lrp/AsnC family transcriptional regulator, leucine-responsive regulatory protein
MAKKSIVSMPKLDAVDRRLLAALQNDGRLTATELAARAGLTTSPCLRRLRRLEDTGVIRGYAALVDQKKVGLPVSVFVSIKLERQREEDLNRFEEAVRRCPEVVECYLMTGQRDYLLRVVARDLADYERIIKETLTRIEGVASIESSFALSQVKHSNALPLDALA